MKGLALSPCLHVSMSPYTDSSLFFASYTSVYKQHRIIEKHNNRKVICVCLIMLSSLIVVLELKGLSTNLKIWKLLKQFTTLSCHECWYYVVSNLCTDNEKKRTLCHCLCNYSPYYKSESNFCQLNQNLITLFYTNS